ncbi:MAG: hypothetical protein JNM17_38445 [Archangium sp.]|nr:hypothetical protein [Archangium sp.]
MSPRLAVLATLVLVGCNDSTNNPVGPPEGPGLGATCNAETKCRAGLKCGATSNTCEGSRESADGTACTLGVECVSGNCAPNGARGACAAAGTGTLGTTCKGDSDCAAPFKCGFDGERLFPACLPAGTKDVGAACTLGLECAQGLICIQSVCATSPLTSTLAPNGVPPILPPTPGTGWKGAACEMALPSATKSLFMLPRDSDDATVKEDFYRLPFPNDALRDASGRIDFSRHPKEPNPMFGFDLLGRYFEALATEPFGNAPTVILRFDGPVDFSSVTLTGTAPSVRLVKLEPMNGAPRGLSLLYNQGRNQYVCPNWLAIRPFDGDSLQAGTYAVVLLRGIRGGGTGGSEINPSADFSAMVAATAPTEARQALAYPSYAPLRAWMTEQNLSANDIVGATVFTVANPRRLMDRLAASVTALPAPTADTWVKCGGATPSPCPDVSGPRACGNATGFDEWHSLIEVPIYQQGTAPYLVPSQGGGIDNSTAALMPVRREKVCASLTVPKGTAPAAGWPVVLYAHGTGGTYRGHAGDGAASALTSVTLPGVAMPLGAAVLGFDQVGHGPRRGAMGQMTSPDDIVFNFVNPASGRGTMAQGATDLLSVTKYLKSLPANFPAELPPLDVTHLAFWGHSQGATEGALFLAEDRQIDGALMSGASATLVNSLTSKKAPVDIAGGLWAALGEQSPQAVNAFHPVLGILQSWTDVVDPLHFAGRNVVVPADTVNMTPAFARNVFQVWGKDDLFTARPVQTSYARAAGLPFVGPKVDEYDAMEVTSVSGNVMSPRIVTSAMRQYVPSGYDGHFVVFSNPAATTDATRFVGRVLRGEVPTVPEP